jgi:hypothetical protein
VAGAVLLASWRRKRPVHCRKNDETIPARAMHLRAEHRASDSALTVIAPRLLLRGVLL